MRHRPSQSTRSLTVPVLLRRPDFRAHGARLDTTAMAASRGRHRAPRRPSAAAFIAPTAAAWSSSRPIERTNTAATPPEPPAPRTASRADKHLATAATVTA